MSETVYQDTTADTATDRSEVRTGSERRGWLRRQGGALERAGSSATTLPVAAARRPPIYAIGFILLVLIPTVIAGVYFGFYATKQFTAEARFAVRSLADDSSNEKLDASIFQMQAASQDAYVVTSFIHSAEILRRLDGKIDYRTMFSRADADAWSRFDTSRSQEDFLAYWTRHVTSYIDGPSGIVTLRVTTFRPEDSKALAEAIVEESETLVNELSVRARNDMLASFNAEVQRTGRLYQDALAALTGFQKQAGLLSPTMQAQESGKLITGLLTRKLDLEGRLFVMQQSNGTDSPTYRQMLLARESVDQQIANLRGKLTGTEVASLANIITDFSQVETNRIVAEKLYEASRRNYDRALTAAFRKALYLTVFVHPSLPQQASYPRRLLSPALIFLGLVMAWATLSLLWASVEDHRL